MYHQFHGQHQPPVDQRLRSLFPDWEYRGTFLDVGAGLPAYLSGSLHFERNGWRTVCVEPNPYLAADLRRERAEVIECAVADYCAEDVEFTVVHSEFGQISASGLEVFPVLANDIRIDRLEPVRVPVHTLDCLLQHRLPEVERLEILSIDTEGYELPVLRGLTRLQPEVIVLENYRGHSSACCPYLEERGYEILWAEGLNEFYRKRS